LEGGRRPGWLCEGFRFCEVSVSLASSEFKDLKGKRPTEVKQNSYGPKEIALECGGQGTQNRQGFGVNGQEIHRIEKRYPRINDL